MEVEIVEEIIQVTKDKLEDTGTSLNLLDILQAYDAYIKRHKLGIELKTKVYKGILDWNKRNLNNESPCESELSSPEDINTSRKTNSDLEYDFRETFVRASSEDEDYKKRKSDNDIASEKSHKKMTLPKLRLQEAEFIKEAHS